MWPRDCRPRDREDEVIISQNESLTAVHCADVSCGHRGTVPGGGALLAFRVAVLREIAGGPRGAAAGVYVCLSDCHLPRAVAPFDAALLDFSAMSRESRASIRSSRTSEEKPFSTRSRPPRARRLASEASARRRRTAAAIAAGSRGGTRRPESSSTTSSGLPPAALAMTGTPRAMA